VTSDRARAPGAMRIPAGDIESLVVDRVCRFLDDRANVHDALKLHVAEAAALGHCIERAVAIAGDLPSRPAAEQRVALSAIIAHIDVGARTVEVHVSRTGLADLLSHNISEPRAAKRPLPAEDIVVVSISARLRRTGMAKRMVIEGSRSGMPDATLIRLIAKAFRLRDRWLASDCLSIEALAHREKTTGSYATRLLRLTFLAPDLVRDILEGRQPATLTANALLADTRLPMAWKEQRKKLGWV
jgi:site-specific DNA recombinase